MKVGMGLRVRVSMRPTVGLKLTPKVKVQVRVREKEWVLAGARVKAGVTVGACFIFFTHPGYMLSLLFC